MNCRDVSEFLDDYVEGSLSWRQRMVFFCHLLACADCRHYLASYRQTIRLANDIAGPQSLPLEPPPEELVRAILAARPRTVPTADHSSPNT